MRGSAAKEALLKYVKCDIVVLCVQDAINKPTMQEAMQILALAVI